MIVRAGQEEHVVARKALEPRNRVRDRRAVGVPDVQFRTWVVDGSGDVEWFFCTHISFLVSVGFLSIVAQTRRAFNIAPLLLRKHR